MAGHRAQMDAWRKGWGGNCLCSFQPGLVYLWNGIITEVYYPTVDRPQLRDLQYLITDGKTFSTKKSATSNQNWSVFRTTAWDTAARIQIQTGRYAIVKEIITDPHLACVLQHTKLTGDESFISKLRLYALCAPHLRGRRLGQQRLCDRGWRAGRS